MTKNIIRILSVALALAALSSESLLAQDNPPALVSPVDDPFGNMPLLAHTPMLCATYDREAFDAAPVELRFEVSLSDGILAQSHWLPGYGFFQPTCTRSPYLENGPHSWRAQLRADGFESDFSEVWTFVVSVPEQEPDEPTAIVETYSGPVILEGFEAIEKCFGSGILDIWSDLDFNSSEGFPEPHDEPPDCPEVPIIPIDPLCPICGDDLIAFSILEQLNRDTGYDVLQLETIPHSFIVIQQAALIGPTFQWEPFNGAFSSQ